MTKNGSSDRDFKCSGCGKMKRAQDPGSKPKCDGCQKVMTLVE